MAADTEAVRRMLENLQADSGPGMDQARIKVCNTCFEREPPGAHYQKCSRCKTAIYCGRECQVKDWPRHKAECKAIQENVKFLADTLPAQFMKDQEKFMNRARPAISLLVHKVLGRERLRTHAVILEAAHQPGKKPPFKITDVQPVPLTELQEDHSQLHERALEVLGYVDTIAEKANGTFGLAVLFSKLQGSDKVAAGEVLPMGVHNTAEMLWSELELLHMINTDTIPRSISSDR